jgi:hypothetical protein
MFDKLLEVEKRFEEINELVCQPEVVADQQQYTKLMKEIKHLTPVVDKFREYKKAKETFDESKMMLDEGGMDSDFADMVREEFEQSKEDIERISEELKILLLPRDPNDDIKTLSLKSAAARAARKAPFLRAFCSVCIQCMQRLRASKPRCSAQTKPGSEATRKSAFPLMAMGLTAALNLKAAFTACSAFRKPKAKGVFTPQQQRLPCFPRRKRLILSSAKRICR